MKTPYVNSQRGAGRPPGESFLNLLGGFSLRVRSEPLEVSDMAQRLVAFLALGGRPMCRSLVAGKLWPEKTDARASANLRSSLWRLNAAGSTPTILCSGSGLVLNPGVLVDVAALERDGWDVLDGGAASRRIEVRFDWFAKELLPGWYEDWVLVERERLGQLQIRFMEALVNNLRERGEFVRAIDQAMRLVAIDPLRERSQLALIRALVEEGSWGRARWQADQYCLLLDSAFGPNASSTFMVQFHSLLPFEHVTS